MDKTFLPILVTPAIPHENKIRFLHQDSKVDIKTNADIDLWEILEYCDGRNTIENIAEKSKIDLEKVSEIISKLVELGIITDSREQYLHFHSISNFPTPFSRSLTQSEIEKFTNSARTPSKLGNEIIFKPDQKSYLVKTGKKRKSCRSFSRQKLSVDQIGNICRFGYSLKEHFVPSGGALYPLKLYVLVEKPQLGLAVGYYEYDAERDSLICFSEKVDEEQLKYCFNSENMPFGSSIQIIIAADLGRQSYKYSNRGYRLTLIEVGHVAENISLYCAENSIGACELGGVLDEALKQELELDSISPLLAIAIGYKSEEIPDDNIVKEIDFVEKNTGGNKPVIGVSADLFGKHSSFFGVTGTYKDGNSEIRYAGATSASYNHAAFKAVIESYERFLSSQTRTDFYGSYVELKNKRKNPINPNAFFPLLSEQAEKCGLDLFDEQLEIAWTTGVNSDGNEVYLPSDIIYYGQPDHKNRIYFGHSSGIAAAFDFKTAEKCALTELIERDAIMRNWFSQKPPKILSETILPRHIQHRKRYWRKEDRELLILQLPSNFGGIVFEAVIIGKAYPFFISGAAATLSFEKTIIEATILKALEEAEFNLLLSMKYPSNFEMTPEAVLSPSDHGRLYHQEKYAKELAWLWSGEKIEKIWKPDSPTLDFEELKRILKTVTIDLSRKNIIDLSVVRVFSPKLVQINFGFHSAHFSYPFLKGEIHPDSLKLPHYFA